MQLRNVNIKITFRPQIKFIFDSQKAVYFIGKSIRLSQRFSEKFARRLKPGRRSAYATFNTGTSYGSVFSLISKRWTRVCLIKKTFFRTNNLFILSWFCIFNLFIFCRSSKETGPSIAEPNYSRRVIKDEMIIKEERPVEQSVKPEFQIIIPAAYGPVQPNFYTEVNASTNAITNSYTHTSNIDEDYDT